jgi:hypothetical protein
MSLDEFHDLKIKAHQNPATKRTSASSQPKNTRMPNTLSISTTSRSDKFDTALEPTAAPLRRFVAASQFLARRVGGRHGRAAVAQLGFVGVLGRLH